VAGFKTSRFRKPAPPAIQHVSFLFRRSYYDPTRPSFSRHRMAVMRSPGYTPLFMHENVPAPISAPTRIRIGHPKKDLLHISNSGGILRSKCSVPSLLQIGDHESRYEQRSHFLLLLRKILYLLGGICCIILLRSPAPRSTSAAFNAS